MKLFSMLSFAALIGSAIAECENRCNGNGACSQHDKCECYPSFEYFPDCSARTCPYGRVETTATTSTTLHPYAECSGRGTCDRASGICQCLSGFTGHACHRETCPNGCSGKGKCVVAELANSNVVDDSLFIFGRASVCVCDPGYQGVDCSKRQCPRGDDPLRCGAGNDPVDNTQRVRIDKTGTPLTGTFVLQFTDQFGGVYKTRPLDITKITVIYIEEALVSLPDNVIPSVTVAIVNSHDVASAGIIEFDVTFSDAYNSGQQEPLKILYTDHSAAGNQPLFSGLSCAPNCGTVEVLSNQIPGTPHSDVCSGRGNCDEDTGVCSCHKGFNGYACQLQNTIA